MSRGKVLISRFLVVGILALVLIFYSGPQIPTADLLPTLPTLSFSSPTEVEDYLSIKERTKPVKPNNEARVQWANDTIKEKTPYVLLYLHGFSASWYEGYPVNANFADTFGMNALFSRLASHGLEVKEPLLDMTPDRLYDSAKEALVMASALGDSVVIMGTSTGCTLGLMLAADFPDMVHSLILYSPNIKIKDFGAKLLSGHWGMSMSRIIMGGDYKETEDSANSEACQYWYCKYRMEGVAYLQQMMDQKMKRRVFDKIDCPVFMGTYYKDETHQDQTVELKAAYRMFDDLSTPQNKKESVRFPEAGDHVIASPIYSKSVEEVERATINFGREVLGL